MLGYAGLGEVDCDTNPYADVCQTIQGYGRGTVGRMIVMNDAGGLRGLQGLGEVTCPGIDVCPGEVISTATSCVCAPVGAPKESLFSSILSSLTAGVTRGLTSDGRPAQLPMPLPLPEPPWYMTPTGMIGIGVGVLGLIVLMRK